MDDYSEYNNDEFNDKFGDLSISLPSARKIEREAFSVEGNFDVDSFLSEYHQYQTLEDIQEQLQTWTNTLEKELVDLINEDYTKFVGLGVSLNSGQPKVQSIKMEVRSFQKEVKNIQSTLQSSVTDIDSMLQKKFHVMEIEKLVEELILYNEKLSDAESRVLDPELIHDTSSQENNKPSNISPEDKKLEFSYTIKELEDLGTSFLSCEVQHSKLPKSHPFVVNQRPRLVALRYHVSTVFPIFFKEFKNTKSIFPNSIDHELSSKVFNLVLLYKQIIAKAKQDQESNVTDSTTQYKSKTQEVNSNLKAPIITIQGS